MKDRNTGHVGGRMDVLAGRRIEGLEREDPELEVSSIAHYYSRNKIIVNKFANQRGGKCFITVERLDAVYYNLTPLHHNLSSKEVLDQ